MERITSRENSRVKRAVRLLGDRAERETSGLFAAEGIRLCSDAMDSGIVIAELFVTQKALETRPEAVRLANAADSVYLVTEEVAHKISDTKNPQGIFAVCEKNTRKRPESHPENARYLLLSSLQDPGNVGAIIRTAEALGLSGVIMSADCPDIYSPKVLRATMGGAFRLPVWVCGDMRGELERLKHEGITVWAAAAAAGETLGNMRFEGMCAVLLGNEGAGLDDMLLTACHGTVAIPMMGRAESLGVAAAAGIFAWEMTK